MHTILLEYDPTGSELLYQKAAKRADTGEWTHGYLYVHIPYTYAPESVWIYYLIQTPYHEDGNAKRPFGIAIDPSTIEPYTQKAQIRELLEQQHTVGLLKNLPTYLRTNNETQVLAHLHPGDPIPDDLWTTTRKDTHDHVSQ